MATHMIVGMTVGTGEIVRRLKLQNAQKIIIEDEEHIGSPFTMDGVTYMSPEQSLEVRMYTENIVYHFYRYVYPKKR